MTLVVSGGFFALLILLTITGLHTHRWPLRALVVIMCVVATTAFYTAFQSFLGWPTAEPPDDRFRYMASIIREPSQTDQGAIFIWYITKGEIEPRASTLPYSKQQAEMMQNAHRRVEAGVPVYMQGRKHAQEGERNPQAGNSMTTGDGAEGGTNGVAIVPAPPEQNHK